MYYKKLSITHIDNKMHMKRGLLLMVFLNIVIGSIVAQNENELVDSIRISMSTPFDAGVKWTCSCVIKNDLISVRIREFYGSIEIPSKNIVMPPKVIHRSFELNEDNNFLWGDSIPLHSALSNLAFVILKHQDEIRKDIQLEIEPDTTWVVSFYRDGKAVDYFSIGNVSRSDNSIQLNQLSGIIEQLVFIGRFFIWSQSIDSCLDEKK